MVRALFVTALMCVVLGFAWPWLAKLGFGRLPGDITIRRENGTLHIPIVSCLVLSAIVSALLLLLRR